LLDGLIVDGRLVPDNVQAQDAIIVLLCQTKDLIQDLPVALNTFQ
jgi:hypothetical protein